MIFVTPGDYHSLLEYFRTPMIALGCYVKTDDALVSIIESSHNLLTKLASNQTSSGILRKQLGLGRENLKALKRDLSVLITLGRAHQVASKYSFTISALRVLLWFETASDETGDEKLRSLFYVEEERTTLIGRALTIEKILNKLIEDFASNDLLNDYKKKIDSPAEEPVGQFIERLDLVRKIEILLKIEAQQLSTLFSKFDLGLVPGNQKNEFRLLFDDVRRIRNDLVHLRRISGAKRDLLLLCHEYIFKNFKNGYEKNLISFDPAAYVQHSASELAAYKVRADREASNIRQINHLIQGSLTQIALLLLLVFGVIYIITQTHQLDRYNNTIGNQAVEGKKPVFQLLGACANNEVENARAVKLENNTIAVEDSMESNMVTSAIVKLSAEKPNEFLACIPFLLNGGWNINQVSNAKVALVFSESACDTTTSKTTVCRNIEAINRVFKHGYDFRSVHPNVLLVAILSENKDMVSQLISHGADLDYKYSARDVDKEGSTERITPRELINLLK